MLAQSASANGRFPRAERLLEDAADPNHLVLAATYGLLVTQDRGQTWFHVCEASFAQPGQQTDPVVSLTGGALLTSIFTSLTRSTDGCDFQRKLGGTPAQAVPDFTIDSAGAVLAALVTTSNGATTNQLQESLDGGQHFHALGPALPDTLRLVATVDVAPSDPKRIYVSGLGLGGVGVLLRSDDRGESFTTLPLPTDAKNDEVPFIAAVEPNNPDALYVRTDVWKYDELAGGAMAADALLYSDDDGGSHFSELLRQGGKLFGFALSPDGQEVLAGYGDPVEGGGRVIDHDALGIYRAPAGTSSFEKAYSGPVSCLTWSEAGVYACTSQGQTGSALGLAEPESLTASGDASFMPLLSLLEVKGPLSCDACASGAQCRELWQATCSAWGRADCDPPSATPAAGGAAECPAAGGADAGEAGGSAQPETGGAPGSGGTSAGSPAAAASSGAPTSKPGAPNSAADSSCSCRAVGSRSRSGSGLALLALWGVGLLGRRRSMALLSSALALTACGNKDASDSRQPTINPDDECSGDFDTFEPGMTKLARPDDITVELVDAAPSPPVVRSDNVWWLKLSAADGTALLGAQVVASPYMPKHQHGSAEVVVEEQGEGQYQLSAIELIMPGVWEIPLSITPADGAASETQFRFCIAEL